jgi:hypothetical protein
MSGQEDLPCWPKGQITEEEWQDERGDPSNWYVVSLIPEEQRRR